jgi:hypothetical protein
MSLLFIDGFDHYATADITKKWNSVGGSPSINATGGRRGSGCFRVTSNNFNTTKTFAASSAVVAGFAYTNSTLIATIIAALLDAGTVQVNLHQNADGTLSVTRNGAALTNGTSTNAISAGTYYYIEWKMSIANSIGANTCKVRVNGVDWITVATGQDTQNTANATCNQLRIGIVGAAGGTHDWDDLYLLDLTGPGPDNDFLGDVRIDTIYPNADGNYSQFTPSTGTDHYALVDETTPNTTDYNDGDTVGDRDSYAFGNLTALTSQTVYGVQVNAAILKDDAGAKSASTFARSGATNTDGASAALSTSQAYISQIYTTDPNGGGAWTESAVNAAEFGVRVTA